MKTAWRRDTLRAGPTPPAGQVVKIGGSLLTLPDWPKAVAALVASIPEPLLVVGGGALVDGLRAIDAASTGPPALVHELAIDAMSLTARLVAAAVQLPVVATAGSGCVLDAAAWLRATGPTALLPAGWHVTSDSIAATVAAATGRGLVLAKLVPPPEDARELDRLAASGWVDPHFPVAAAAVAPIAWAAPG